MESKNLDKNLLREALNFLTQKYKETGSLMRSLNLTMYVADKHGAKGRLLNKTLEKTFPMMKSKSPTEVLRYLKRLAKEPSGPTK